MIPGGGLGFGGFSLCLEELGTGVLSLDGWMDLYHIPFVVAGGGDGQGGCSFSGEGRGFG